MLLFDAQRHHIDTFAQSYAFHAHKLGICTEKEQQLATNAMRSLYPFFMQSIPSFLVIGFLLFEKPSWKIPRWGLAAGLFMATMKEISLMESLFMYWVDKYVQEGRNLPKSEFTMDLIALRDAAKFKKLDRMRLNKTFDKVELKIGEMNREKSVFAEIGGNELEVKEKEMEYEQSLEAYEFGRLKSSLQLCKAAIKTMFPLSQVSMGQRKELDLTLQVRLEKDSEKNKQFSKIIAKKRMTDEDYDNGNYSFRQKRI